MTDSLQKLREPFPAGTVGKLPKLTCGDCSKRQCQKHQKAKCRECEAYISTAHIHLDFVGHAAVTDRLLNVDPAWTWEPLGFDDSSGLPVLDREGNLWIRLTVCGVSRIGVGDGANMKERIGDAIRNAAMRFGVALSLWTKDELESGLQENKPDHVPVEPPARAKPDMVEAADAKRQLVAAYGGDKERAALAWGTRGSTPIPDGELAELLGVAKVSGVFDDGRPFEEAK